MTTLNYSRYFVSNLKQTVMAYDYQDLGKVQIEVPDFKNAEGEIHIEFNDEELRRYIKTWGSAKLVNSLVRMTSKVIETEFEIKRFHDNEDVKACVR